MRSLTFIEFLIVLCVIFIFLGVFAFYGHIMLAIGQETALRSELSNLRLTLEHFRMIKGRYPENLMELVNQGLTGSAFGTKMDTQNFIKVFRIDKDGYFLDPFRKRYLYNNKDGRVYSQTKGYERW